MAKHKNNSMFEFWVRRNIDGYEYILPHVGSGGDGRYLFNLPKDVTPLDCFDPTPSGMVLLSHGQDKFGKDILYKDCPVCGEKPVEKKYVEAWEFFKNNDRAGLANGPNNDGAIELIEELISLGCKVFAELDKEDEDDEDDEDEFDATLMVHLPKKITTDILVCIATCRADEVSEEESGVIRLWWD